MDIKSFLLSKTIWTATAAWIATAIGEAAVLGSPGVITALKTLEFIVQVILRFVTTKPIKLMVLFVLIPGLLLSNSLQGPAISLMT